MSRNQKKYIYEKWKKYWFDCTKCNHEFEMILCNIVSRDSWCPYCYNDICTNKDCMICFKKSFASHEKAKYWSIKNSISLRDIMLNHNTKVIMNYDMCKYEFKITPNHIISGNWCRKCVNKTELKLYKWLKEKYPEKEIILQKTFEWCKSINSRNLRFDFEIDEKILIEVDGPQHFKKISNWESPEIIKERDKFKIKCVLENNKHIIHINQINIFKNINNWDVNLSNTIDELINKIEPTIKIIGINEELYN